MEIKQLEIKVAWACIYSYAIQRRKNTISERWLWFLGRKVHDSGSFMKNNLPASKLETATGTR